MMPKLVEIDMPPVDVYDPESEETYVKGWRIQSFRSRQGQLYERAERGSRVRWWIVEDDDELRKDA